VGAIAENITAIRKALPSGVMLVAVSKTKPAVLIEEAYQAGQRVFGENRAQEMAEKHLALPKDIEWHMIGHMQSNKVKYIAPFVSLIHSIDGLSLLQEVNKQAKANNRVIDCLLQFHIAEEENKYGLNLEESLDMLSCSEYKELKNIRVCGVMGMATFTDNNAQLHKEFAHLNRIFGQLKSEVFSDQSDFKHISMGMSGDFQIAIEEGSTMVRIGSSLFGSR
jgi:PLP dependent protein